MFKPGGQLKCQINLQLPVRQPYRLLENFNTVRWIRGVAKLDPVLLVGCHCRSFAD